MSMAIQRSGLQRDVLRKINGNVSRLRMDLLLEIAVYWPGFA